MRKSHTTILERAEVFTSNFATEPYEAAWASEAIFFIKILEVTGENASLKAEVQISPDGIEWTKEGTESEIIKQKGLYFLRTRRFGVWLRLNFIIKGEDSKFRLIIYLTLKE